MIKWVKIGALILTLAVAAVIAAAYYLDELSLWSSSTRVKSWLLGLTPLGSSFQSVKDVIKSRGWKLAYENQFYEAEKTNKPFPPVKGTSAIGVDFGEHPGIPFSYGVDAYWGFDSNSKLIDLTVRVNIHGL